MATDKVLRSVSKIPLNVAHARVASLLAGSTYAHRESVKQNPQLAQNAAEGEAMNIETAIALGIEELYFAKLSLNY